MGVDVRYPARLHPGVRQSGRHRGMGPGPFGVWGGHVVRIAGQAIAQHLGIDLRAPIQRGFQGFQHQNTGAFGHHHAHPPGRERPRHVRRHRSQAPEARELDLGHHIHAPGKHGVRTAITQQIQRMPDAVVPRGACGGDDHVRAFETENLGRAACHQCGRVTLQPTGLTGARGLEFLDLAHRRAQTEPDALGRNCSHGANARICQGHRTGGDRKLRGTADPVCHLGRHEGQSVEVRHFATPMHVVLRRVEGSHGPDAAAARQKPFPESLDADAQRG